MFEKCKVHEVTILKIFKNRLSYTYFFSHCISGAYNVEVVVSLYWHHTNNNLMNKLKLCILPLSTHVY